MGRPVFISERTRVFNGNKVKGQDLVDLGLTDPASPDEYRKAGLVLAGLAIETGAGHDELAEILQMIGYPNG